MSETPPRTTVEPLSTRDIESELGWGAFLWGLFLEAVVQGLAPMMQMGDILQPQHPAKASDGPLAELAGLFGSSGVGEGFTRWWLRANRRDSHDNASGPEDASGPQPLEPMVERAARQALGQFLDTWEVRRDRLLSRGGDPPREIRFLAPIASEIWYALPMSVPSPEAPLRSPGEGPLGEVIDRVRSYFAPLESPFFGMTRDMLAQHVDETIPQEMSGDDVTQIVPLFGPQQEFKGLPSAVHLPAHLRILLQRLERAQENRDLVASLLSTLEAIDFTIRFATGLGEGCLSQLTQNDDQGSFAPTTKEIVIRLKKSVKAIRLYWDQPVAAPCLQLLFRGQDLHPFLRWAGLDSEPKLVSWMLTAEDAIREDNPARCSTLLQEAMASFNEWVDELVLLFSSWDTVCRARQDGYLQFELSRGEVWVGCRPLVDPTRYSVWLERGEMALAHVERLINPQGSRTPRRESLDGRIVLCSNDPPFLSEQISTLLRAYEQGHTLPLGRSLFFGIEYLVRFHSSLAGGLLRYSFDEMSLLDPVTRVGGPLDQTLFFLAFSLRTLADVPGPEAKLLREVFFEADQPRPFTKWLGVGSGVPGPLQGLLGWSLSLQRPDVTHRLIELRGQIQNLSGMFAEFVDASRHLWSTARLQIERMPEESEAVVLTFPSGLKVRGLPDVRVGPQLDRGRRKVVVGGDDAVDGLDAWMLEDDFTSELAEASESDEAELKIESNWPSFFSEPEIPQEQIYWDDGIFEKISIRCQEKSYAKPEGRPPDLARAIVSKILEVGSSSSSLTLVQGAPGTGRTLLCRTLTNPASSPLPEAFPVLYLKVDRFPLTRLSTVIERLNDHIASETSLIKFGWKPVPTETLRSLGSEVERLSRELAEFGQAAEPLANRLSSYLRYLQKINEGRQFLLVLDGFDEVPHSLIPRVLSPGIHLLVTGTRFPALDELSPYLHHWSWDLSSESQAFEAFSAKLEPLGLPDERILSLFHTFSGSLFQAELVRSLDGHQNFEIERLSVLPIVFEQVEKTLKTEQRYVQFLKLLSMLALYERPVPLRVLQERIADAEVVDLVTESFPALFAFWGEPEPALGLAHPSLLPFLLKATDQLAEVATDLAEDFLKEPRRNELLPALLWIGYSKRKQDFVERFFAEDSVKVWRDELSFLLKKRLFFQRVALLDATERLLTEAVEQGAGHLLEELAWLHNARGLSLLELGLLEEARSDFETAIEQFHSQFAAGEPEIIAAIGSATNRLSEAILSGGDPAEAEMISEQALEMLYESRQVSDAPALGQLSVRAHLQRASVHLRTGSFAAALVDAETALTLVEEVEGHPTAELEAVGRWRRAEALAGVGRTDDALNELELTVDKLFSSGTFDLGVQALTMRGRIRLSRGDAEGAYSDLERVLSQLRYQVAGGRLDLEPMLAYAAAQRSLTGIEPPELAATSLDEFVEWARHGIRYEGRSELRPLLASMLLCRGERWKDAGKFGTAVDDLRAATEQYDLLCSELERSESEPVWNEIRTAFANLAALYLSLDEAPLALMCARRALSFSRVSKTDGDLTEMAGERSTMSLVSLNDDASRRPFIVKLTQSSQLYLHMGEATRRLGLKQSSSAYFERAARGFAQLFARLPEPSEKLVQDYALALKYAATTAKERGDFEALRLWLDYFEALPKRVLSPFDAYMLDVWSGHRLVAEMQLEKAAAQFLRALERLELMPEHPRQGSLMAETFLALGRVRSLQGQHQLALDQLERAAQVARNALFDEGEENRDLLVQTSLHAAVALLRSGKQDEALDQLRILVSFRPSSVSTEVLALAEDWGQTWYQCEALTGRNLVFRLSQLCGLGDWLLRTPFGSWFQERVAELVEESDFELLEVPSAVVDQILETFLVVTFSQSEGETMRASSFAGPLIDRPELEGLLLFKHRALVREDRLLEAELVLSHLLSVRRTEEAGNVVLKRSEMALLRGERALALVDLLRATGCPGDPRVEAHLRLAEFLLPRSLTVACTHHLKRALLALLEESSDKALVLRRGAVVLSGLAREGSHLSAGLLEEFLRLCGELEGESANPELEAQWLKALGDYHQWTVLAESTVALLGRWLERGQSRVRDWDFLENVLERTLLWGGMLELELLENLGKLLVLLFAANRPELEPCADRIWERFISILPSLGRQEALAVLRRLFDFASGTAGDACEADTDRILVFLEEEIRLLKQPH